MNIETAASKWRMLQRSVKNAVQENRVRNQIDEQGNVSIPDDEIRPLRKPEIQTFLWVVLKSKNDPSWRPDYSVVRDLPTAHLLAAFRQLTFRKYLDGLSGAEGLDDCLKRCRVTDRGLKLVAEDPLPGSSYGKEIFSAGFPVIWEHLLRFIFAALTR